MTYSRLLNADDRRQIAAHGLTVTDIEAQIDRFERGFPYATLKRPCTVGDGIMRLTDAEAPALIVHCEQAAAAGRVRHFIPASGAASRMFKSLLAVKHLSEHRDERRLEETPDPNGADYRDLREFLHGIEKFAFYQDLQKIMKQHGLDLIQSIKAGHYQPILRYLLASPGLDYADLPKGLLKFHRYSDHTRTPFEEHLIEASHYIQDGETARLHFTISHQHQTMVEEHINGTLLNFVTGGRKFDISFSSQKSSTDTIAVDLNNDLFRLTNGRLLFRPGGHGSLLENLSELEGDIIFVKNIDNVVPDHLKAPVTQWKKILGGCLLSLQEQIFAYLRMLHTGAYDTRQLQEMLRFARDKLGISQADSGGLVTPRETANFLQAKFNRPLRVCGMVRNVGEPGGGPFWIEEADGSQSLQIVESSQVDFTAPEQEAIWRAATHFNPVDLVCGVRDFLGKPFALAPFADPDTGFIAMKSQEGRELKALEWPGLWNGGMARWNTAFVEVPLLTFNPVKTVLDLLRKEHQPG